MIALAVGTGRCGTMTMAKFFESQGWASYHEESGVEMVKKCHEAHFSPAMRFTLARIEYRRIELSGNKSHYFESSSKFYPFISMFHLLDPQIKFIYLLRDKCEFIQSGLTRKWYQTDNVWDQYRPQPPKDITDVRAKIGWLWDVINDMIEDQLSRLPPTQWIPIWLDEFTNGIQLELEGFLGVSLKLSKFDWSVKYNA